MKNIKPSYIFNIFAIILLVGVYILNSYFSDTKQIVSKKSLNAELNYTTDLTNNIIKHIKSEVEYKDLYSVLLKNNKLRKHLEGFLQTFNTKRYKYIYIVQKVDKDFRFLLDGSKNKNDKAEFGEFYTPLKLNRWNEAYHTKKIIYFSHKDDKTLWMTFINPIVQNDSVEGLLVLDFSIEEYSVIVQSLNKLDKNFDVALIFALIIFVAIIIFSYLDFKREAEKEKIKKELETTNKRLEYSKKYLENRVKEEVLKSRQKDAQLVEQSRLAQMGEMISMIAHQWRQPLSAIGSAGNSIIIKAQLGSLDNEKAEKIAEKIVKFAQHLSTTIDDFRSFFKNGNEKVKTNYNKIINTSLSIVEASLISKDIKIIKELECKYEFIAFENELKQVVLNLIKNAEDILMENQILNPYIKIKTYEKNGYYILEIIDNGGGIPEDIIEKIFDPYFSTKKKKDGTGLGLYMSKTIVEEHSEGSLKVSNTQDGVKFKIILSGKNDKS